MSLTAGQRLGPYEITGRLGAGGMGEVYRARDPKLNRDVALKVLPEAFTADADRLARFKREAQVLASLNHPNIAAIYGLEDSGATQALVMELVEGPDLSEVIATGRSAHAAAAPSGGGAPRAVSIENTLAIARQIADALEAAHEQGIVHRDLKPQNIKVRPDGTVKVLDFGLAKAADPAGASTAEPINSPTMTARATQMGMIIGTAAYMAPEQARGRAVDRRADIWAFGVVLYEMLTGRRAFEGEDISITLASVLRDDIDWTALPADLPAPLRRLLRRCLEKDPRKRLSAVGDARLELDEHELAVPAGPTGAVPAARSRRERTLTIALVSAVALWLVTLGPALGLWRASPDPAPLPTALALADPEGGSLLLNVNQPALALSHDGRRIVYAQGEAGRSLIVRRLDQVGDQRVDNIGELPRSPSFSPDDKWVLYFSGASNGFNGRLLKVASDGGSPIEIARINTNLRGAAWGPTDHIVFATVDVSTGLFSVSASGGTPEVITRPSEKDGEIDHKWPVWMPDGKHIVFAIQRRSAGGDAGQHDLAALDVAARSWRVLRAGASYPQWLTSGHLQFVTEQGLFVVGFDPVTCEFRGEPVRLIDRVSYKTASGAADVAVSDTGTLVYASGSSTALRQLVWVTRDAVTPIPGPANVFQDGVVSPAGTHVAVALSDSISQRVAVVDVERGALTTVSREVSALAPVWIDERHLLYAASTETGRGILRVSAAGATPPELLFASRGDERLTPLDVTPDGKTALVSRQADGAVEIWTMNLEGPPELRRLLSETGQLVQAAVSPNGRWLAYTSRSGPSPEVFLRPFPNVNDDRRQVTTDGGSGPVWSGDNRTLYFNRTLRGRVSGVDVAPDGRLGKPVEIPVLASTSSQTIDRPTSLGRVLRIREVDGAETKNELRIVFNYFEVVRAKATAGAR